MRAGKFHSLADFGDLGAAKWRALVCVMAGCDDVEVLYDLVPPVPPRVEAPARDRWATTLALAAFFGTLLAVASSCEMLTRAAH